MRWYIVKDYIKHGFKAVCIYKHRDPRSGKVVAWWVGDRKRYRRVM